MSVKQKPPVGAERKHRRSSGLVGPALSTGPMNRLRPPFLEGGWAMRAMAGEGETDESPMSLGPRRANLSTLITYARPMNLPFQPPKPADELPTILAVIHADRLRKLIKIRKNLYGGGQPNLAKRVFCGKLSIALRRIADSSAQRSNLGLLLAQGGRHGRFD